MYSSTWQEIITTSLAPGSGYSTTTTIDGYSQLDTMPNIFSAGQQQDVPFMMGMAEGDGASFFNQTVELVPQIRQNTSKVYAYMLGFVPTGWKMDGGLAFHSEDREYIFGAPQVFAGTDFEAYAMPSGAKFPDPGFDARSDWFIEFMVHTWIQFAATGDPNLAPGTLEGPPLATWPPYEFRSDQYFRLDDPPSVNSGFSKLVLSIP